MGKYIKILYLALKFKIGRFVLTFLGIRKVKFKSKCIFEWPFNLRGVGEIELGFASRVLKNCFLFVDGKLVLNDAVILEENCNIKVASFATIVIGKKSTIGKNARIRVDTGHWTIGQGVNISPDSMIFSREKGYSGTLIVGDGSSFSDGVILDLSSDIHIGSNVALGHGVTIFTHNHDYTNSLTAAWKGGVLSNPVVIEDDCWIGANVTIMPGITIGKRAIVATGAVVTRDVPENQLFAGVPAKCVRHKVI